MKTSVPILAQVVSEQMLETRHGSLSTRTYRGADGSFAMALWVGDLASWQPILSRVHSSCFTSEGLFGLDCDCVTQLDVALGAITRQARGVVFYLLQEGRGAGLPNKARDRSIVQSSRGSIDTYGAYESLGLEPDPRRYGLVKPMCDDLGINQPLTLMTNNPSKIGALAAAGIEVVALGHALPASTFNAQYLAAKARNGHALKVPAVGTATVPPGLGASDPGVERFGRFLRVASYGLPVQVRAGPVWLRATSYCDEESGHDRLVLSYCRAFNVRGANPAGPPGTAEIRHVYREELQDRLAGSGDSARRYRAALERIVERGAGSVLAIPADPALLTRRRGPSEQDDLDLLNSHGRALGAETCEEVA